MGFIDRLLGRPEVRAETIETVGDLKAALVGSDDSQNIEVTRETVTQIPSVQGCVGLIAGTIASLPIKLFRKTESGVEEVTDDYRLRILNDETGDTLTATQFWRSMIEDYLLGKGGYAYINKSGVNIESIHYVDEQHISFQSNNDPVFKDYMVMVNGKQYFPHEFFKILRKTKNGYRSTPVWSENDTVLSMAYGELLYELNMVERGGNRKGFLQSDIKLTTDQLRGLKESYKKLYSNSKDSVIVLNKGVTFQEASNTAVEMQLNENKTTNSQEICKLFGVPVRMLTGNASAEDVKCYIRTISAIINDIECSLDRDLLLETEKGLFYFAFDTKELTRGDIKERYEAYQIALKNNFLQIDEVREAEDYEPLGFEWITLGLDSVLYNPKTGTIYTPNNDSVQSMTESGILSDEESEKGGEKDESGT